MVCSFAESTPERPSLLQHRDARILFHELGHAIHHLSKRTKYAILHPSDFGEIPSKMLEHFIWLPEVLKELGKHYTHLEGYHDRFIDSDEADKRPAPPRKEREDIGDGTFPNKLAEDLFRTKNLRKASGLLGFLRGALFDLALYTPKSHEEAKSMDTTALWNNTMRETLLNVSHDDEDRPGQAGWSFSFRGIDVGYYTYLL
jgi:metallopeptidase MepB